MNLIDPSRVFIRGRSAGGFTSLTGISNPPLGTPSDFKWTAATSIYGISDLVAWQKDMHKFQSKYMIGLLGGSVEEIPEVYQERSSLTHADNVQTPILVSWIPPCYCCGGLDFEVDRGLCSSSTERTMLSFCRPNQKICITR